VCGRYWTAEDVGVSPADLEHARRRTRYVAGLEGHPAASGDPSPVTAEGVFRGIACACAAGWSCDLDGVTVALQGVGHVGAYLADKLAAAGARLVIADVNAEAVRLVAERTGAMVVSPGAIFDADAEVFAPCALGRRDQRRDPAAHQCRGQGRSRWFAGGANNQLASAEAGQTLFDRGMLYAPDYVINGGGIINVAAEIRALDADEAYDAAWVETKLSRLTQMGLGEVLDRSLAERRPANIVADEMARAAR
jgi:leucine dehydrogenase